jgi:hypothetical protein
MIPAGSYRATFFAGKHFAGAFFLDKTSRLCERKASADLVIV